MAQHLAAVMHAGQQLLPKVLIYAGDFDQQFQGCGLCTVSPDARLQRAPNAETVEALRPVTAFPYPADQSKGCCGSSPATSPLPYPHTAVPRSGRVPQQGLPVVHLLEVKGVFIVPKRILRPAERIARKDRRRTSR